ncbi:transglycosylase domain-containing protein [Microtetraspora sp. NBRC 16547]|uniref:transglycosylase domain-containing protein n=1 Tax=Microtetraspora sp. NBRC 16547 TaxID=3030993 RepID=UPI00249FC692|nr:transglycosylase domain-containing protein [Microtetraspora sp. NBRC 16547]GLW98297.1 carboxypeptidase [Microtetraspora sp. NBRC 16547]
MQAKGKAQATAFATVLRLFAAAGAAGVLAAAIALPAVGGAGITVKSVKEELNIAPEDLDEPPLPEKTTLLDASGKQIAQFYFQNRESVPLDKISPIMRKAIVAIEDFRFYEHGALDLEGTSRALVKNLTTGGVTQGGSSITQQYVKQVIYNKAETDEDKAAAVAPTFSRKLNEIRYAMAIEQKYSKDEILNRYLNIAYFGAGSYGIEAASKRFFGKHASELNLVEAATLAGAVQNPNNTDPNLGKAYRDRLVARRNVVLDRMAELEIITTAEATKAKAKKLGYKDKPIPGGCEESEFPYFCLYVQNEILHDEQFGKNEKTRRDFLNRGGLTIKTTLNRDMQKAAEKAIKKYVHTSDKPVASEALIEPGTGAIRAMAASRKFGTNHKKNEMSFNVVADALHGGGTGFQAGSTFKMFTLVTALKEGMKFDDGFSVGGTFQANGYSDFKNCKGENVGDPTVAQHNSEGGNGGFKTLQTGTWGSVNTFFMTLERKVGLCDVVKTAKDFGIKRADGQKLREFQTFTLGFNEMDPVTVASAYATLGARGKYCAPMAITEIVDRFGKVTAFKPECKQAVEPEIADATSHILEGVFTKGTMAGVGGIGRDAAGKTGTGDQSRTVWFAGYTPDLAGAVSLGDPRGPVRYPLSGQVMGGRAYGSVFGATIPGPIWKETMLGALKDVKATSFIPPDMSRFGGCSQQCAPRRPARDDRGGDHGDNRGDNGRGNGGGNNGRGNGRGHWNDGGPIILDN